MADETNYTDSIDEGQSVQAPPALTGADVSSPVSTPPFVPDSGPVVGMSGSPTMAAAGNIPQPAPAAPDQQPRLWQRILTGALAGLAGSAGAKSFGGGLAGGAAGGLNYIEQQKENKIKAAESQSRIKFQDAQSASLAAEAAIRDKQLHAMDKQNQDAHNAAALEQFKAMQGLGLQPTIVADNHAQGAVAGLQQLTDSHGAVPPLFTINLGDKIIGFDLNQLSAAPQALTEVNKIRALQGAPQFNAQMWAQMPQEAKSQITNQAFSFWTPMPSEQNLQVYQNYLNTAKSGPDSPDKQAQITKLQGVVSTMQKTLDATNPRANQQLAAKTSAEELAKQNTPQGRATLAKTLAEATKAKAEAAGAGTDKMWAEGKNPITGESLNLSNAPDEMLIDSRNESACSIQNAFSAQANAAGEQPLRLRGQRSPLA